MVTESDISMEWGHSCHVCLQDGHVLISNCDIRTPNLTILQKIILIFGKKVSNGPNIPNHICSNCLDDLNAAYRLRLSFDSTQAILQSLTQSEEYCKDDVSSSGIVLKELDNEYEIEPVFDERLDDIYSGEKMFLKLEAEFDDNNDNEEEVIQNEVTTTADDYGSMVEVKNELHYDDIIVEDYGPDDEYSSQQGSENGCDELTAFEITTINAPATHSEVKATNQKGKGSKDCNLCGAKFRYKHALSSHMRRHNNVKPYKCDQCGKGFVIKFELDRHMRTHTGEKPYRCSYCGRLFSDFGSRIKHERIHTGERPYGCVQCGKRFAYSHVLSSHVLTHTGEKRHLCTLCGRRFTKAHHLKSHLQTHERQANRMAAEISGLSNFCNVIEEDESAALKLEADFIGQAF